RDQRVLLPISVDGFYLALLGVSTAICSLTMDFAIEQLQQSYNWVDMLESTHNHHAYTFIVWSGYAVVLGPFVHVASALASQVSRFVTGVQGAYENESMSHELLAAGAAVGVACTFSTPIGVTVSAYYQTRFPEDAFLPEELPVFALIGLICGVAGALFIKCHRALVTWLHSSSIGRTFLLSMLSSTIPIPAGIFMPVFVIGASFGRLMGESMAVLFPEGIRSNHSIEIYPGVYAVVESRILLGSVARKALSVLIENKIGERARQIEAACRARETYLSQDSREESSSSRAIWEAEQLSSSLDLQSIHIDAAPFQLVENTSIFKLPLG
ncbi:chloride transporter, ClC family, partial [Teladorsagia circumcincta]